MILKLSIYADVSYEGDPALVPLIKSSIEDLMLAALESDFDGKDKFNTEGLFNETPKGFIGTDFSIKVLEPNVVRMKQIQQLQETQKNINRKKQSESSTKKTTPKKKVTKA